MSLEITKEAAKWYKDEMDLEKGDFIQFYVQLYGGIPTNHPNYSLGLSIGMEGTIDIKDVKEGITFYFNEMHSWFLEEFDMKVFLEDDEIKFLISDKK